MYAKRKLQSLSKNNYLLQKVFYICTTSTNQKIQLNAYKSDGRTYIVVNQIELNRGRFYSVNHVFF